MQVFALVPPCPAERALASTLSTLLDRLAHIIIIAQV